MFGLGTTELLIILVIVVMFFGVGKLPMVAKQLGGGVRNFQKSLRGDDEDDDEPETDKKNKKEKPSADDADEKSW